MLNRRHFLKLGVGAVATSLVLSQQAKSGFAMHQALSPQVSEAYQGVILMSAPSVNDSYYSQFFNDLLAFYARMVALAHPNDKPLVVVDSATFARASAVIPAKNLIIGNIADIWMRDFSPIRTKAGNFDFIYAPQYLARSDASYIERRFNSWFSSAGLTKKSVSLILDGGNFCYNGVDSAVITERIVADNPRYSQTQIINTFKRSLGLTQLAIIPEEPGDITGHSDGMVTWLAPNKLGVARHSEPLRSKVRNALTAALPNVQLVEIPYVPHDDVWQGWSTAKGVYVNALTTASAIYIPMFGLAQDAEALGIYHQHATKPVIPVPVGPEVNMGGSVRCLTWDVDGSDAQILLGRYAASNASLADAAPMGEESLDGLAPDEEVQIALDEEEVDSQMERKIFFPMANR